MRKGVSVCVCVCIITAMSVCCVCRLEGEESEEKGGEILPASKSEVIHLHTHTHTHIRSHSDHARGLASRARGRKGGERRKKVMTKIPEQGIKLGLMFIFLFVVGCFTWWLCRYA